MWAYEGIFYQIYPIGFCGAPTANDGKTVSRILKLKDWSSYLESLGISSILLNPIFESDNHGYDTRDYKKIDCRLGTNEDFVEVCKDLHAHNVKIVLDGVFNHVGRGFWAFKDVQEKKWDSPYKDWFCINFDGNSCYNDGFWYEGWEGHFELVKLNLANSAVVDYLLECVKGWIDEFDIDGLRLDVAYCLDRNFMKRLRSFCQELKPDFALIGEVLFGDYNQIVNDEMLHSCTNYECYKGIYSSFNSMNMFEIAHSLNRQYGPEQWCIYRGKHLMSFVDNHDVTRIASILTNKNHLPLTYGLLLGMPGVPCIYYGSEWGEEGVKAPNNDYALRPCFEEPKPNELTEEIKKMIHVRTGSNALCHGSYRNVVLTNHQLIFERRTDDERMLVAINASDAPFTAHNGELGGTMTDLLTGNEIQMSGQLEMPPYSVQYLK
ncbi:maltodextrin glucosidase [Coprococcus comes]|uniref:alpha-amylase family glycosyl hydrolase n=1 Tax=Coprococcus comes TaxID=410072 RepID=UPI00156EEE7A|nr:alpha-amylase family glycosyl hydrolase [Coprococcus comes]MCB6473265.1 alpha-glucosidase C-terminal domain-containing protein [Coprococcus comes]NSC15464.1 maltodextrin glucosidase [Coprococcus comes]NSC18623.1 maltodextrin glucosidase [Coprococcus comes]NSC30883.1 maltodextrin glucosidase [Coprococcus comes]NSC68512.1 maltodextrin glucosidase [Coprococcus comes]